MGRGRHEYYRLDWIRAPGALGGWVRLRQWRWLMLLGLALAIGGCQEQSASRLEQIRERGELIVLTRNAPTTYFQTHAGVAGVEADMVQDFATHLGVVPRFELVDDWEEMFARLEAGEADLAAAGISRSPGRLERFRFGPGYQTVRSQVVCHRDAGAPASLADLEGVELAVVRGSVYQERLDALQTNMATLEWRAPGGRSTEDLLMAVWEGEIDCTVADSNVARINRRYFPELEVGLTLGEPDVLAWAMPAEAESLQREVERWFRQFEHSGALDQLLDHYYGYVQKFDYVDLRAYRARVEARLPRYVRHFKAAGEQFGLPWTLLAAIGYQESHWDPQAVSPTGVAGIMMLTNSTARSVGVANRLDPRQSIHGGAEYLAYLRERLPESVPEPDRTWIALAAYNIGLGHVLDARQLAREQGLDPDRWASLRQTLPLLSKRQHYRNVRHGYARGRGAVRYVARIRNYQEILRARGLIAARAEPQPAAG